MGVDILLEENATAQVIDMAHEGFFFLVSQFQDVL